MDRSGPFFDRPGVKLRSLPCHAILGEEGFNAAAARLTEPAAAILIPQESHNGSG